jgi:hypothetical protein
LIIEPEAHLHPDLTCITIANPASRNQPIYFFAEKLPLEGQISEILTLNLLYCPVENRYTGIPVQKGSPNPDEDLHTMQLVLTNKNF